ncbi:MAG: tryptophan synthase subunit alpha [Chloroflexi bacterium]|nr:tryptophan synthase subunit alpha [Chloroflexota bacterium]
MNRIDKRFGELKTQKRTALMPYLPMGFPSIDLAVPLIRAVADAGADVIELGVPFSDPIADGPVIQAATQTALKNGMSLQKCIDLACEARMSGITTPFVLMGYLNPILRFGVERFARAAHDAGVDGVIVPDLPPEEASTLDACCRANDLDLIFLAAPTSTRERLQKIAEATHGFLYLVSVTGVTGARAQMANDLSAFVARVRTITSKPVCVGFGIANAESAKQVAQIADGVIVGSALVAKITSAQNPTSEARNFVGELFNAISPKCNQKNPVW